MPENHLRTIGIKPERAERDYNIACIDKHMTNHCAKVLNRILKDPEHLITKMLIRTTARPVHPSIFKPNKARTIPSKTVCIPNQFA